MSRKTYVTDVTIVLHSCPTDKDKADMFTLLKDIGLEDAELKPECVVTGYINSYMTDALKKIEHIGYVRTSHSYYIDIPDKGAV